MRLVPQQVEDGFVEEGASALLEGDEKQIEGAQRGVAERVDRLRELVIGGLKEEGEAELTRRIDAAIDGGEGEAVRDAVGGGVHKVLTDMREIAFRSEGYGHDIGRRRSEEGEGFREESEKRRPRSGGRGGGKPNVKRVAVLAGGTPGEGQEGKCNIRERFA